METSTASNFPCLLLHNNKNNTSQPSNPDRKHRHRNIIWYNPPYSKNVATKVGKSFLKILDEEFPKDHMLHKIFNSNPIKICYSCMSNIKHNVGGHNKSGLNKKEMATKKCNCRKRADCPMNGDCLEQSVVYQATMSTYDDRPDQTYVGLTLSRPDLQTTKLLSPPQAKNTVLNSVNTSGNWKTLKLILRYHGRSRNKLHLITLLQTAATYAFGRGILLSARLI